MAGVSDEEMAAVAAIRQSFESTAGAGSSVNAHPNAFFIILSGQFDLLHAAKAVVERLRVLHEMKAKAFTESKAEEAKELARAHNSGST